jgi:ribosomal protein S18 acetylase RimI-like enzyme
LTVFIDYPSDPGAHTLRGEARVAIRYRMDVRLTAADLREVFEAAGLKRPVDDGRRLGRMARGADLTVTAWDGKLLVGIARVITDFAFCAYVSDLGVRREYQRRGIGRELLRRVRGRLGDGVMLLLLENQKGARGYYAKVGFEKADNAWKVPRKR